MAPDPTRQSRRALHTTALDLPEQEVRRPQAIPLLTRALDASIASPETTATTRLDPTIFASPPLVASDPPDTPEMDISAHRHFTTRRAAVTAEMLKIAGIPPLPSAACAHPTTPCAKRRYSAPSMVGAPLSTCTRRWIEAEPKVVSMGPRTLLGCDGTDTDTARRPLAELRSTRPPDCRRLDCCG